MQDVPSTRHIRLLGRVTGRKSRPPRRRPAAPDRNRSVSIRLLGTTPLSAWRLPGAGTGTSSVPPAGTGPGVGADHAPGTVSSGLSTRKPPACVSSTMVALTRTRFFATNSPVRREQQRIVIAEHQRREHHERQEGAPEMRGQDREGHTQRDTRHERATQQNLHGTQNRYDQARGPPGRVSHQVRHRRSPRQPAEPRKRAPPSGCASMEGTLDEEPPPNVASRRRAHRARTPPWATKPSPRRAAGARSAKTLRSSCVNSTCPRPPRCRYFPMARPLPGPARPAGAGRLCDSIDGGLEESLRPLAAKRRCGGETNRSGC